MRDNVIDEGEPKPFQVLLTVRSEDGDFVAQSRINFELNLRLVDLQQVFRLVKSQALLDAVVAQVVACEYRCGAG